MAGTTYGSSPASRKVSTVALTSSGKLAMPRLPTPTATVCPGSMRASMGLLRNSLRTAAGMSAMLGASKTWSTASRVLGKSAGKSIDWISDKRFMAGPSRVGLWLVNPGGNGPTVPARRTDAEFPPWY
ncbi:MAG: hypothetical protein R2854_07980 [Caldilineaceae bacterium]